MSHRVFIAGSGGIGSAVGLLLRSIWDVPVDLILGDQNPESAQKAKDWISNEGFSTTYGARPLKRLIQTEIIDKIANLIMSNQIKEEAKLIITTNKKSELEIIYA